MIAVGVASPMAQGQAINSTETDVTKAKSERRVGPVKKPDGERRGGEDEDHGHEDAGDLVGEALDRWLGALRLLDHADDLAQHRIGTDAGGPQGEGADLVDGAADDLVTGLFFHRCRLAGNHRFIDVAGTFRHHPVHGDALSGADKDQVPGYHFLDGDFHFFAVTDNAGGLGLDPHQFPDRFRRAVLGDGFQITAEQNQRDDDAGGLKVRRCRVLGKDRRDQEGQQGIEIGGAGAEHHQAVHARVKMAQFGPAVAVEPPPGVELDRRRQQPFDTHPAALGHCLHHQAVDSGGHLQHGDKEQRHREGGGQQQIAPEPGHFLFAGGAFAVVRFLAGDRVRRIAGGLDGRGDAVGIDFAGTVSDGSPFIGQVDHRLADAGNAQQHLFDAADTRRAGHSPDLQRQVLDIPRRGFIG